MAESEKDAQASSNSEETEPKKTTRRPAKKRATKKTAKKTVKKTRAKKKDGEEEAKTSSRPAKKRVSKKRVKKATKTEEKDTDNGRTVISRRPNKKPSSSDTPLEATETSVNESTQAVESDDSAAVQTPVTQNNEEATPDTAGADAGMQWGRRAKKSAPIGWEEQQGGSDGARNKPRSGDASQSKPAPPKEQTEAQVSQETEPQTAEEQKPESQGEQVSSTSNGASGQAVDQTKETAETPTSDNRREQNDSDNRRGRSRGGRNRGRRGRGRNDDYRNRNDQSDRNRQDDQRNRNDDSRNRNDNRQERNAPPAQPVAEPSALIDLLATSWTEEKTREYLNDGILTRLSPGLLDGSGETLQDTEAIKEPLKAIRRVLADECMVADDVADIMLLDVVMGALADRIEVCRLQANQNSLQDMNILMDMRCKADKRLIEAVNALKNA